MSGREAGGTITGPGRVSLIGGDEGEQLVFTVVFHPCRERIGERAEWAVQRNGNRLLLGRESPGFSQPAAPESGLGDAHLSRRALQITGAGDRWRLARVPGSSRLCVQGQEVFSDLELDAASLRAGLRLQLAHNLVLLLRLEPVGRTQADSPGVAGLLGTSRHARTLRRQVARAAAIDSDVLLLGPTGTGKELLARAIHAQSRRSEGPMVAVNMAAIPAELAAATLFGSTRGAYTGATDRRLGYFEQARGGTLFLDEIGDAPATLQPQLLRALEQREVQVVGGDIRPFDARIVSATDVRIDQAGADFRAALRHRLGAVEIRLLPLCEHPEDIGLLAAHYLEQAFAESGREALWTSLAERPVALARCAALFDLLLAHDWPGNVRELVNTLRQVAISVDEDMRLPAELVDRLGPAAGVVAADRGATGSSTAASSPDTISETDFDRVWEAGDYEVARVARRLGVSRQTVYRRVQASPRYRLACDVDAAELRAALEAADGDPRRAARSLRVSFSGLRSRLRALERDARACDAQEV
jgi:two-component system nitrogen regulation response regulator GlnG